MSPRPFVQVTATLCVWCCAAAVADAQQLDVSTYVGAGDPAAGVSTSQQTETADLYLGVVGNVTFERRQPNRTISASLGGALRYFPDSQDFMTMDRSASVGIDAQLRPNTRFRASQTVQYSPYRQFGGVIFQPEDVGELPIYNPDGAATLGESFYDLGSMVELSRQLSQRTALSLDYRFRVGLTDDASELPLAHRAGIGMRHVIGRYAALKLGTAYRFGRTGYQVTALPTKSLDFDVGIDYNRPLSFSRGTTISFSSGTALVSRSATALDPGEVGRNFVAIAAATIQQTIGRHWEAQLGADRNLQYVDGFPDPFYATRITTRLSGEMGRNLALQAAADYSTGGGLATTVLQNFNGVQAQARLNYKLSRRWQLFGAYYFTENRLSADSLSTLPAGLVLRPNQTSVQVGINFRID